MRLEYKWLATLVGVLGLFMSVLDNTIVNVAIPAMQSAFHTDRSTITWVVTGYFLAQAAIIPITGYLSDRWGTKLVYIVALAIFTVGSALCAFSPGLATLTGAHGETVLIIARIIQGIGGGALFPVVFAITFRVFPPEERGPASAVIGVPILLAPAFGPTIGGYLTDTFNWNAIFLVNVPLGIIGVFLAIAILRGHQEEIVKGEEPVARGFDIPGLLLSMVGVTALVYGINKASDLVGPQDHQTVRGWGDPQVLTFLIIGIALLIGWVLVELRSSDPVMDVRLFKNYTFTVTNILTWGLTAALFGALFLYPVFFENVQGKTPLATGEILIPQGIAAAIGVVISGRLYNSVGPRPLVVVGLLLAGAATFGFTNLTVSTDTKTLQAWLVLRGVGFGLSNIPLQTLVVSRISNQAMARASSLVNVTRQIFSAVGITLLTSYLIQQTTTHIPAATAAYTAPQQAADRALCVAQNSQHVANIPDCIKDQAKSFITAHATTLGLNDTFLISMIAVGACVALALFIGRDPNVERLKAARARGEQVEARPSVAIGE